MLKSALVAGSIAVALVAPRAAAAAEALLLIEADTGKVLQAENATYPWYPASVTKIMTAYVALKAVKQGRLTLDSLLTVSPIAAAEEPSKMGFPPGTQLTLDNALKMMMVKSANDVAVTIAEGVAGSVQNFADEMNLTAQRLGMTQSHFVNPNGLPDENHISSARDLAMLARAVIRDLPEYEYYMQIYAIKHGRRVTRNFNRLIGRYPGADGMKTGFICASGYNLVASASRNGKRLIAVVLGASSGQMRAVRAAQLLERGFSTTSLTWLKPSLGTIDSLAPIAAMPPNLRDEMCGPKRKRPASDADEESTVAEGESPTLAYFAAGLQAPALRPVDMIAGAAAPTEPVIVYTGPKKSDADLIAHNAAEAIRQTPKPRAKKAGKKSTGPKTVVIDTKPATKPASTINAAAKPAAQKPAAKPTAHNPSPQKPTAAKPAAAKPAATSKPAASQPAAAAKPASPKPATAAPKSAGSAAKPKPGPSPAS